MILKLIIFATLIAVIYFKFFKKPSLKNKKNSATTEEIMVECEQCSTYISNKEAVIQDTRYYCSDECAKVS